DDHAPLDVPVDQIGVHEPDYKNLIAFLKAMGFRTLTQRVSDKVGIDAAQIESAAAASATPAPTGRTGGQGQLALDAPPPRVREGGRATGEALTPISLAAKRIEALKSAKFDHAKYHTIGTLDDLNAFIARAHDTGTLAIKVETNGLDPMQAALCGIALAVAPNEAAYLPLGHRDASDSEASGLFAAKLCAGQIAERDALTALKSVLEDNAITKIGHDVKREWLVLACRGTNIGTLDDTMLMSYVLDAGKGAHDMDAVAYRYFGRSAARFADVKNKEKALLTPEATPIARAAVYAGEDADASLRLWHALKPRMAAEHVVGVYETLERPLPRVLARME